MSENETQKENPQIDDNPIQSVAQMADRLEKANIEAKEILKRQEELYARNLLGGQSQNVATEKPKEESAEEYAKRVLSNKVELK
jgi:hypothetical protein